MNELRVALLQIAAAVYVAWLDLDALREWRRRGVWGGACRRPGCYGRLTGEGPSAQKNTLEQ